MLVLKDDDKRKKGIKMQSRKMASGQAGKVTGVRLAQAQCATSPQLFGPQLALSWQAWPGSGVLMWSVRGHSGVECGGSCHEECGGFSW